MKLVDELAQGARDFVAGLGDVAKAGAFGVMHRLRETPVGHSVQPGGTVTPPAERVEDET